MPQFFDRAWLSQALADIRAAGLRCDAERNLVAVAESISELADWRTGRSRPGLATLVKRTGLGLRTVQRWCRWLERRGHLALLHRGTTAEFRPGILHGHGPNLAREWRLTRGTVTPPHPPTPGGSNAGARAVPADASPGQTRHADGRCAPGSPPAPPPRRLPWSAPWPLQQKPRRRGERRRAAEAMRGSCVGLVRLSARALASKCRLFWTCDLPGRDWTPAAILAAIDSTPDGRPVTRTGPVYDPDGWLDSRLSAWVDANGWPLPPPAWTRAPMPVPARVERARGERAQPWRELGLARPERGLTDAELAEHDRNGADPGRWSGSSYQRMLTGFAMAEDERLRQLARATTTAAAVIPAAASAVEADRRRRAQAQVAAARAGRGDDAQGSHAGE